MRGMITQTQPNSTHYTHMLDRNDGGVSFRERREDFDTKSIHSQSSLDRE